MLTKPQERWLTALESGDYQQGRGCLHKVLKDGKYFCCLGIACHLFQEELGLDMERKSDTVRYNGEEIVLPLVVQEHLMLRDFVGNPIKGESLTYLNDSGRNTFKEIAAIIRDNPSHYFDKAIDNHVD